MKKRTAALLALLLACGAMPVPVAAENQQNNTPQKSQVTVTTSIEPTYTVTIPANTRVAFNAVSTEFGAVKLDAAQLDPGYAIQVELSASGKLKNAADASKTISYAVNHSNAEFTSAKYTAAGQETPLTIDIAKDEWNRAAAGSYSDTVTFTVSYVDTTVTP